jgi:hypothetical protein
MKSQLRISIIIVILILLSMLAVNLSAAQPTANELSSNITSSTADNPWRSEYVHQQLDPPINVGSFASLAFQSWDDRPYISYYNQLPIGGMYIADPYHGAHTRNCGTDDNWYCRPITDYSGDVGQYSSIDLWGESVEETHKIGISYFDATNQDLKVAIYTCTGNNYACSWDIDKVYYSNFDFISVGLFTSIKFDSNGTPRIVFYYDDDMGPNALMYTYPVASDGNCGYGDAAGLWECETIDNGEGIGQYASIDMSWDDQMYVAYYDAGAGNLKLAHYAGFGNCGHNNEWQCDVIDGADGSDVGMYASLKAPQSAGGAIRIAYYDKTNGQLKFYNSGLGIRMVVDDMGNSTSPMGISMDIDKDSLAVIAYKQITSDWSPPALRIARPYLAYADGLYGDCGDKVGGNYYWRCTTLDNGSQYTEEADYVSLAVNSQGLVSIAYTEVDVSEYAMSLKFINQLFIYPTFLPLITKP